MVADSKVGIDGVSGVEFMVRPYREAAIAPVGC